MRLTTRYAKIYVGVFVMTLVSFGRFTYGGQTLTETNEVIQSWIEDGEAQFADRAIQFSAFCGGQQPCGRVVYTDLRINNLPVEKNLLYTANVTITIGASRVTLPNAQFNGNFLEGQVKPIQADAFQSSLVSHDLPQGSGIFSDVGKCKFRGLIEFDGQTIVQSRDSSWTCSKGE